MILPGTLPKAVPKTVGETSAKTLPETVVRASAESLGEHPPDQPVSTDSEFPRITGLEFPTLAERSEVCG